jgi:UDP-N-acetyl-D-mannosaminuronic acid dehydrogenase
MAPGSGIEDLATNKRVIGAYDSESAELGAELFSLVTKGQLQLTDLTSAEVAKLAENTYRYVNIAFANELALICKEIGVDVAEVIRLANTHPRVRIHNPGCGAGGPCLSKDTHLLLNAAKTNRLRPDLIISSVSVNKYMPRYIADLAAKALGRVGKNVENSRIAVFGTAYKGDVNDARDSPAKDIIRQLRSFKTHIVVYDPYCNESFGERKARDVFEATGETDCIIIATDHNAFKELDLSKIKSLMKENPIIIDGRRVIKPDEAERLGFAYIAVSYDPSFLTSDRREKNPVK